MELNSLPAQLKLFNFSRKEVNLSGQYQISDLPRISEIASNKSDNININLSFYLDNDKTADLAVSPLPYKTISKILFSFAIK